MLQFDMFWKKTSIIVCVAISVLTMSPRLSYARSKAIGATYSFTGISASYEHFLNNYESFIDISLKAETFDLFLFRDKSPGITGSVSWNLPLKKWFSINNNEITVFAGPGVTCGYVKDYKLPAGYFFGLKGRLGIECNFSRNVTLSAYISPIIGTHLEIKNDHIVMRPYRNGLTYGLIPELGIKYSF